MYHKISDMVQLIEVINLKAQVLKRMKYNEPKSSDVEIDLMIQDIQGMCRQVANDRGTYRKDYKEPESATLKIKV